MYSEQSGMEEKELFCGLSAIAVKAGDAIMRVYSGEIEVELKDDNSPLTAADRASHDIIMDGLGSMKYRDSPVPIISEEGEIPHYGVRRKWKRFWLIDPLDGTREFVNKRDEFTVNIALMENNKPLLGLVYLPVRKVLYFGGAYVGTWRAEGSDLKLENAEKLPLKIEHDPGVLRAAGSRSHRSEKYKNWLEAEAERRGCRSIDIITAGSSLKFCLVAEGAVDIYPRFGPTMEWDTAAAHAVVEGAGKRCTDPDGGSLLYNKKVMRHEGFIVF